MKLIVGLGNPGKTYIGTRHNVGFRLLDKMVEHVQNSHLPFETHTWSTSKKGQLEYIWLEGNGKKVELMKPLTMMNNSGKAVAYVRRKHPELLLENVFVCHDDLDILLGKHKIQFGKGPRQHNGLASIYERLGSKDFWHVRIGIERRIEREGRKVHGEAYVLQRFAPEEGSLIERTVQEVAGALLARLIGS
jgi:peptidyl-tRNA hydrolase, PTH1 family